MATGRTRTSNRSSNTRSRTKSGNDRGKSLALGSLSIGAIAAALGAAAFALLRGRGKTYVAGESLAPEPGKEPGTAPPSAARSPDASFGSGEHPPTDLMGDKHPGFEDRAVDAFRPDPTAPVPEGERDAFRPALAGAAAPTLVAGQAREHERTDAAPS